MLIRSFLLFIFFSLSLLANVEVSIPNSIIKGEALIFSVKVSGNKIKFPDLTSIDGNSVQEISSSSSTNIINGEITKQIKKIYTLYPNKSVKFPSLQFEIDSKKFYTNEKEVTLNLPTKTKSDIFELTIKSNKNEIFVGEDFVLTLIFKYKKNAQIVDLAFEQPRFDNFWFKQLNKTKKYEEGEFIVQELNFLLIPLKEGELEVSPLKIQAQVISAHQSSYSLFSRGADNQTIYSNSLKINSKVLPSNIDLIGSFNIEALVDKTNIKRGEPVSYKLKIVGIGNIDDLKDIKLDIPNATIYENKPVIKTSLTSENRYAGEYTKSFSIIPSESLEIPSISIRYFDKVENKVVEKKTKKFNIEIEEIELKKQNVQLQKAVKKEETKQVIKVIEKTSIKQNILYFCLGIIVTLLILGLYWYVINSKKEKALDDKPLIKKVKASKNKDELFKLLVKYVNQDKELDELIFKLEKSEDIKNIKKSIISLLKHIDIKR